MREGHLSASLLLGVLMEGDTFSPSPSPVEELVGGDGDGTRFCCQPLLTCLFSRQGGFRAHVRVDLHPGMMCQAQQFGTFQPQHFGTFQPQPWSPPWPGAALCHSRLVPKLKPVLTPPEEGTGC